MKSVDRIKDFQDYLDGFTAVIQGESLELDQNADIQDIVWCAQYKVINEYTKRLGVLATFARENKYDSV